MAEHESQVEGLPIGEHAETFTEVPDEIPPLKDDASPEEKDLHWFTHVYQGDRMPQLTFRAVAMGAVLGMLTSVSNLYTTLKVGWAFGVAITACVLSYVIWNLFRALSGGRLSQMSILENNCMQSTASAAGYSTGATIATCFGALLILSDTHQHQPWWVVASFTLSTGAMGVFLAIPMKRQMINQEQLPFPSGIAAATTLKSLYSEGVEAARKAYALVISLFAAALIGFLKTGPGQIKLIDDFFKLVPIRLPDAVPEAGFMQLAGKRLNGLVFEPSALLIAAGMIVGLRVSLSMLAASALLYFVLTPYLVGLDMAQAGVAGYVPSIPSTDTSFSPVRWALWGGTAIMVFSSLMSLALQWKTVARSFSIIKKKSPDAPPGPVGSKKSDAESMAEIEVPGSWLVAGMVPITIALLLVQWLAFDIALWKGLIAVGMSFVLSLVACRATGETDTTPIGAMGKVMQLMFAVLSKGSVQHNLVSAGVAANSASSSADLLTDLKSGYLLGANPRKQFIAQFIGIFFGCMAIVPAWYLLCPDLEHLQKFDLPATMTWVAVAQVLSQGIESLPHSAIVAVLIGAAIGCLLPVLEKLFPKARPYLPSAMGLGLGWVVSFSNALAFTIGAIIALVWYKVSPKTQEAYNIPIASGLVAGESLVSAFVAMIATAIDLASR